jgi:hypothetical protein
LRGRTESDTDAYSYTHSLAHSDASWDRNSNAHREPDADSALHRQHVDSNQHCQHARRPNV